MGKKDEMCQEAKTWSVIRLGIPGHGGGSGGRKVKFATTTVEIQVVPLFIAMTFYFVDATAIPVFNATISLTCSIERVPSAVCRIWHALPAETCHECPARIFSKPAETLPAVHTWVVVYTCSR